MKRKTMRICAAFSVSVLLLNTAACGSTADNEAMAEAKAMQEETAQEKTDTSVADNEAVQEKEEESSLPDTETETQELPAAEEENKIDYAAVAEGYEYVFKEVTSSVPKNADGTENFDAAVETVTPYFGYRVPEGWNSSIEDILEEDTSIQDDSWYKEGTVELQDDASVTISTVEPGLWYTWEETAYNDFYEDYCQSLQDFYENGTLILPAGLKEVKPESGDRPLHWEEMEKVGETETPYGKGIYYKGIETGAYCDVDNKEHESWQLNEGMLLSIGEYLVMINYSKSDWYRNPEYDDRAEEEIKELYASHTWSGELEEIVAQMF